MATAISGCVILNENGSTLNYQEVCPKCGNKQNRVLMGTPSKGTTVSKGFVCRKCHEHVKVQIKG